MNLVDQLARCAALGLPLQDWDSFLQEVLSNDFAKAIEWSWLLFADLPDVVPVPGKLLFPAKPETTPTAEVIPAPVPPQNGWECVSISLKLITCNVLTLQGHRPNGDDSLLGSAGPSRQEWILSVLAEQEVSIFALQETRQRTLRRQVDQRYLLIQSPATTQGHFGMMIGLSKCTPYAWIQGEPIYFQEDDFLILVAEPRLLILQIRSRALRCVLIAAHAPHTGASIADIEHYWENITARIPCHLRQWSRILLADANCRLGGYPDGRIGPWQSEGMPEKSQPFADFLAIHDLFLPSTFEECHQGPGGTWQHTDGTWKRNDFVGLDCNLPFTTCHTWVSTDIDFSLQKEDHRPLVACIAWEHAVETLLTVRPPRKLHYEEFDPNKIASIKNQPLLSFATDVHTHAWRLQQQVVACGRKRKHQHKPQKTTITAGTWDLIKAKQKWRNALAEHQNIQHQTFKATFFAAWRFSRHTTIPRDMLCTFDQLLSDQDRAVAEALFHFRMFGRAVTRALRADDVAFFNNLASEISDFLAPQQSKEYWRILRRSLPKFKGRRMGQDPHKLAILQDQWGPYFSNLECGVVCAPEQIVQDCHARQMQLPIVQDVFHIDDIPSIVEFEDALRSTNADKATGLDPIPSGIFRQHAPHLASAYFPLLLKMCFWQHEPVASKGGQIAVIYKKGSGLQAADYRGIMLLPSVAKRVHALLRSRLIKLLSRVRPQGQLGGFPAMQAPFGSQILQTFGRLMDTIDISSAVVFIDLSNAFHRLIRELVSGIVVPADIEDVLERLMHENFPLHAMLELLQMPCLLQSLGAPPFLIQLIQDLHTGTWMYAPGMRQPIVTKKGTRPGSPLADCIFHVLMTSMASDLNQVIADNSEFQRILARVDLHAESIIWADDIAVPVATEKADSLPGAIEHILHAVHEIFAKRGFSLNFRKGKTSVVATFRGSRAPLMRAKYQLCTRPGMEVRFGQSTEFIHFPAVYKHLGTIFSSAHTLDQEIATRIGMARGAFAQVAGPVLCNRRLPEPSRIKLFRALIESRLFFGMGAWPTPTARQMAKIHAALLAMLRKLFRLSHDEVSQTSSAALFHRAGICSPRARLALDRLRYAQSVWMNGPEMLQHSLHREEALRPDSWLLGLKHDLAWLRDLVQDDCPFFQAMRSELDPAKLDLTEIFDLWQADADAWKLCLKRAWKRFCFQENMTHDLLHMNKQFFRILEDAGASFDPSYQDVLTPSCQTFPCHCGRQFTTAQGLATHQRKAHQIFSIEHDLLEGTTCPECLRHFWSKLRLYQHLSYIPRKDWY